MLLMTQTNYSAILHNDLWGSLYAIAMALKVWWSKHKHTRTEMCLIPQVQNMNYKLWSLVWRLLYQYYNAKQ